MLMNSWESLRERLHELAEYAAEYSVFYKERLSGITTSNWSRERFEQIPKLEKGEIIGREELLLTDSTAKLYAEFTSGSTGQPLKCYKSNQEKWQKARLLWRIRGNKGGIGPKDPYAMFYAFNEDDLTTDTVSVYQQVMYMSMLDMSSKRLDTYYEALLEYRPQWLLSVSTALYLFANHLLERNFDRTMLPLKYIEINGEMLFDYQRQAIEKAFGPIVYNHYGSREFWCIAMSCRNGNLHLSSDQMYVEILNADSDGYGNVVITDLTNKTWPLIRYDTGDIGRLPGIRCTCGSAHPVIEVTGGRATQYIRSGSWISSPILFHYAVTKVNRLHPDAIRQFRVTQEEEKSFLFHLVPGTGFQEAAELLLKQELRNKIPDDVDLTVDHQDRLNTEGPKFDYFIPYRKAHS
ncbi:hypothetical protein BK140_04500 [Paenibacillus macerans]|nr:hypothetical protein BK140_04500 [Paenibacillus macerans]